MTPLPPAADAPTLTVVIPALDEEEAIGGTVQRCLDAVEEIQRDGGVGAIEIIVVSDGSTDRTVEIAESIAATAPAVTVVRFEENQGYGAAIQEGFRRGTGELVGFLDADGTCDPRAFAPMARLAAHGGADMVLGSRLGPDSRMPAVRRFGNRLFAALLGFLCGRWITDTASGMRVLRRSAYERLCPLPDGLHFTPSLSARALLNGMRVTEIPMGYEERIGRSKLSVWRDGVRFLRTIAEGVLCFQPERIFLFGVVACTLLGLVLAAYPIEFYLRNAYVEEWMIYRFMGCGLLGSFGYQLLAAAALANRMASFGPRASDQEPFWSGLLARLFSGRAVCVLAGVVTAGSIWLLSPGLTEFVATGHVTLHWSRVVVGGFGLLIGTQALISGVLVQVIGLWRANSQAAPGRLGAFSRSVLPGSTFPQTTFARDGAGVMTRPDDGSLAARHGKVRAA